MRPPASVVAAFGASGEPRLLDGGQGVTWRVGDVVLKPVADPIEHAWVCEVYAAWSAPEVAVPRPLRADEGWSVDGWGAHAWVPGVSARVGDDPDWFRDVAEAFHVATAPLPVPAFVAARDDAWSAGDRVAWDGAPAEGQPATLALLDEALTLLRPVDLPRQVVHGDLGGNVLRDGGRAAVIDWPPYVRPTGWALAVVAMDAVCWEGAPVSLLDRWADEAEWDQLLLRAMIYRVATRGRNEVRGVVPAGSEGYVAAEGRGLRLVRDRILAAGAVR